MTGDVTVTLTKDESQAIGLLISIWYAENVGVGLIQAIMLAEAADSVDQEVMAATLESIAIKFSDHEVRDNLSMTEEEFQETKARRRARLDQQFSKFAEQERNLWRV